MSHFSVNASTSKVDDVAHNLVYTILFERLPLPLLPFVFIALMVVFVDAVLLPVLQCFFIHFNHLILHKKHRYIYICVFSPGSDGTEDHKCDVILTHSLHCTAVATSLQSQMTFALSTYVNRRFEANKKEWYMYLYYVIYRKVCAMWYVSMFTV